MNTANNEYKGGDAIFVAYDKVSEVCSRYDWYWMGYQDRAYFDSEQEARACVDDALHQAWERGDFDIEQKREEFEGSTGVDLGDFSINYAQVGGFRGHRFYGALLAEAAKVCGADLTFSQAKLALPHLR